MLRFFFTRHDLPAIHTSGAIAFKLKSSAPYQGKIIPFSHIYVTSRPYLGKMKRSLDESDAVKIVRVSKQQEKLIKHHPNFPTELASLSINTLDDLKEKVGIKKHINIVIINGIGTGFGDNYVGLGAMQRLSKLLEPSNVTFHLMQNMNERAAPIFMHEENIIAHNNCIDAKQFMQMDFYINLTYMLSFPEFEEKPLSQFMAYSFLVDRFSTQAELLPKLKIDSIKSNALRLALKNRFKKQKPIVLFHPKASSPLRTMQKKVADCLIDALIEQGFNVAVAIPYSYRSENMCHLDDLSQSIDDLLHIAEICDATVSVGTVLYHLTGALNKPTILLPTVKADVDSGELLPTVTTWVPENNHHLIMNLHKSRQQEDLDVAKQIWSNIDPKMVAKTLYDQVHTG